MSNLYSCQLLGKKPAPGQPWTNPTPMWGGKGSLPVLTQFFPFKGRSRRGDLLVWLSSSFLAPHGMGQEDSLCGPQVSWLISWSLLCKGRFSSYEHPNTASKAMG